MTTPHKEGHEYRLDELRLLDKRVAELKGHKIEFLKVRRCTGLSNVDTEYWCYTDIEDSWGDPLKLSQGKNWSTNIADAWELFEELPDPSLSKIMKKHIDSSSDHISYTCAFYVEGDSKTVGYAKMATSPNSATEAICLCYIKFKDQTLDLPKGE